MCRELLLQLSCFAFIVFAERSQRLLYGPIPGQPGLGAAQSGKVEQFVFNRH